jgi:hypothetical protein
LRVSMGDDSIIVGTVDGTNALIVPQANLYAPLPNNCDIEWAQDGRAVRIVDLDSGKVSTVSWHRMTARHRVVQKLTFSQFRAELGLHASR